MPENTTSQLYEFGGFRLDPLRFRLNGPDGEAITLKPKVFRTLLCLVEHAGELLDKNTLMREIWGDAVVEENSLNKHISALRHVFGETPGENRYIVTVPGQGYRFVATVRMATRAESERPNAVAGSLEASRGMTGGAPFRRFNRSYLLAGAAGAALLLVIAWSTRSPVIPTSTQTIAVLPFVDQSPDGEFEHLSDAISIDLTQLLTKIPNLRVTGRESVLWFKGKGATYGEIGAKLGVGRLLEGTVQVVDDQVRVTASLIDTGTGALVWSDSIGPRPMTDVFAIQTEIARSVVDRLQITIAGEFPTVDETTPEVRNLVVQASRLLQTDATRVGYARDLLLQAVHDDPNYFPARYWLGVAYYYLSVLPGPALETDRAENRRLWLDTFEQARLRLGDRPEIDLFRALQALQERNHATAAEYLERALRHGPGPPEAWATAQNLLYALNRPEEAVEIGEHVLLEMDPFCAPCYANLAANYYLLRRFEDVIALYTKAEDLGLEMPFEAHYALALTFSGDTEAALAEWRREGAAPAVRLGGSAMTFHALGQTAEYEQALAELNELAMTDPNGRVMLAPVYAFVGDIDQAFETLNGLPQLTAQYLSNPAFDSLRQHPRYDDLRRKAGIYPEDPRDSIRFEVPLPP